MLESIVATLNSAKQATPTLLAGAAVAASALLFLPNPWIQTLGLTEWINENRRYVGAALVGSLSLLLAHLAATAVRQLKSLLAKRRSRRAAEASKQANLAQLEKLTPEEKAYLIPYVAGERNTMYFNILDGIVGGLQAKGIIYRAASVGDLIDGFAFNMQPWAREHLTANMQLLNGAKPPQQRSQW